MLCSTRTGVALAAAILTPAVALWAQQNAPERRAAREAAPVERRVEANLDHYLISCLKTANQTEIAVSRLAQQRSTNDEVKEFAEKMVKQHTEFLGNLEKLEGTSGTNIAPRRNPDRENDRTDRNTDRDPTDRPVRPAAAVAPVDRDDPARTERAPLRAGGSVADRLMQIKDEVAERCQATIERELSQKEGTEFDKAFIGMQVGAHFKMVDELTVFKKHASPQLQQVIAKALTTSEEHLEHAKRLCKQLEPAARADTAARDEEAKK